MTHPTTTTEHYSYQPIDLGFDPRVHADMQVTLPAGATSVDVPGVGYVEGDRVRLLGAMRRAGLRVIGE